MIDIKPDQELKHRNTLKLSVFAIFCEQSYHAVGRLFKFTIFRYESALEITFSTRNHFRMIRYLPLNPFYLK